MGGIHAMAETMKAAVLHKAHDLQVAEGLSAIRHAGFGENYGVEIVEGPLAGMFCRGIVVIDTPDGPRWRREG